MINPTLLWNPPERDLAMALKKALASMPVPVPTAPMVPVSSAPFAAVSVSAGPATPNRPRAAKTAVPSAAGDLPDCSLCGGSVKVTKVVKETKNKGRDFYACDCTDPYFIVFVDEYNASPAAANAAKLHTLKRATRMPPTSRTWTSFQPKGTNLACQSSGHRHNITPLSRKRLADMPVATKTSTSSSRMH
jgi:hypothetical protein